MPGIAKRKYVGELMRFNKSLKRPLNLIQEILPIEYTKEDILNLFKELYPFEWETINQRYKNYQAKDKHLVKVGKKKRYCPEPPEKYFYNLQKVKHMISEGMKLKHKNNFDETKQQEAYETLKQKRKNQINKRDIKIKKEKENIQTVEPLYIDIFINAYHKKGISTEGKIEILKELEKYECKKSLEFFYKLNDSERNNQVRNMAFKYLQRTGHYVKLRKNFKGKKKSYMTETDIFFMTPKDLVERIEKNSIQNKKKFDYFISHSYKDNQLVIKIKKAFNELGFSIYCDWTSDNDFLKRKFAGEYTEIVLKKRIEQSKHIVFIRTENTNDSDNNLYSDWVKMELEYANKLNKNIVCIDLLDDGQCEFNILKYDIDNNSLNNLKGGL